MPLRAPQLIGTGPSRAGNGAVAYLLVAGSLTLAAADSALAQTSYSVSPAISGSNPDAVSRETAARAAGFYLVPELDGEFDFTDNVKLTPSDRSRSDFVTQITPRLTVYEKSAHTMLTGTVSAATFLYARTGSENNAVRPEAHLVGSAELLPHLFFVDTSIQVSQEYISPFGARPQSLVNATSNRYTAQSYRVSPYLKGGEVHDGLHYELRDDNTWTNATNTDVPGSRSYTNEVTGNLTQDPRPVGWALEYSNSDTMFSGQQSLRDEIERVRGLWQVDPQVEISASAGYEETRYPLLVTSEAIYGAGFRWHPSDRSSIDATWEHRFFGSSYRLTFDHRTPLTTWSLKATRDITTYPQQLATLTAGADVATLLDRLFAPRIPDIALRQSLVDQLIRDRGLPAQLASPLALLTQQVLLEQSVVANVGVLGARNALFFSAFRTRSEPVAGGGLPPEVFGLQNDNTQTGANIVWTYKLTPLYTLSTTGDWVRTVPNGGAGVSKSIQRTFRVVISAPLSPHTDVYAGARHQVLDSVVANSYHESAVFIGIHYLFR